MSFRTRLALVAAAAVALAVIASSAVAYFVVRDQLYGQIDNALTGRAKQLAAGPDIHVDEDGYLDVPGPRFGEVADYIQAVPASGPAIQTRFERGSLPVSERARALARGEERDRYFSNANVADSDFRVLTMPASPGYALQIARPLGEVNGTLHRLTWLLIVIALGGIAVAAGLGLLVSRAALGPVRRLTGATERVTATGDLSERIDPGAGTDELSRLAGSFNAMLGALEESTRAQRQLVADASHELRTPLTSLRTNIEVLASERELPLGERDRLLTDVVEQLGEMTTLIAELIELARGDRHPAAPEDVRLDLVAADAIERTRRNRPGITFNAHLEESTVRGVPSTIERAVANLLDNAAKWSPPEGQVEVEVREGRVVVRDHGPGIDDDDLPHVFDRFYRARSARGLPGSGLGLAIVRQVAEAHGGTVTAERAEGGGTRMTLSLNGHRPKS